MLYIYHFNGFFQTKACSYSKSKIGCTDFCTCSECENEWNIGNESDEEPSSDEE